MKDRDKSNTHTEESQDIDDNINYDNLSKDVIDDHMKDISEDNVYPENGQDVDYNIIDISKG